MNPETKNIINILGYVCIAIVAFYILKFIVQCLYNNFLATALRINAIDLKKTGKWAVVTGATDGIGKAYAEALAKKDLKVVLISRTQSKLDDVAASIQKTYKVETKTIAADFTGDNEIYYNIEKQLLGLDIGILINNVGLFYPYPEYFLNLKNKDELYDNIVKCNITSVTKMSKIVLPGMVERKRGVIVNIASSLALVPSPMVTVYSAAKAYVAKFSEDLGIEYKKDGITVQCQLPGLVATKLSNIQTARWDAPYPEKYVKSAIATIGVHEKTTGYFSHTLFVGVSNFVNSISPSLFNWIMIKQMTEMKTKALSEQIP